LVFESFDFERTWWRLFQKFLFFNYFILRCIMIHEHYSRLPKMVDFSIPSIREVVSQPEIAWTNGSIWHASSPSVDVVLRIFHIFIVVELVLIDLKYISFESGSKWKCKSINRSVSSTRRTNGLLTTLSNVVLIQFGDYQHRIYPNELEVKDATDTQNAASYLEVDNGGRLKNKTLRQMRVLHFSNSQLPLHQ